MTRVRSFMLDMIIMLLATAVVAVYTYGIRALWMIILSVFAAVMTEALGYMVFMKKNPTKLSDLSAIFTGLAIALAMPSSAPFWLAPVGAIFAIAVAKIPFGDTTTAPFVPAAVGIGFITLSYPKLVFTYPSLAVGKLTSVTGSDNFVEGTSLASMLSQSKSIGSNILNVLDIFVGRIPGPMGASCLILMIGTFLYLIIRRQSSAVTTLSFLLTCSVFAFLFPRILTGRFYSVLMELAAGLLFYAAVFFLSDPTTGPETGFGRVLYGMAAGILTMIFRRVGAYEESVIFVIILMNAISDIFDNLAYTISVFVKNKGKKPAPRQRKVFTPVPIEGEVPTEPTVIEETQVEVEEPTTPSETPKEEVEEEKVLASEEISEPEKEREELRTMTVDELLASLTEEGGTSNE